MGRVWEGWGDMRGRLHGARMCCIPAGQAITCTKSVKVRGIRELVSHVDKVVFTQAHKIDQSLIHNRFKLLAIFDVG